MENVVGNRKGKYPVIKKWFLKNYKEEYNAFLSLDIDRELAELENELEKENESAQRNEFVQENESEKNAAA